MSDSLTSLFRCLAALTAFSWQASLADRPNFPPAGPPQNEVVLENRVAVPMRDGVILYADVYRPALPGKFPVILGRTPYSTDRFATPVYEYPHGYEAPLFLSRRGYVFVHQDTRGRHESEGKWEPFRDDINDGFDTIEWAARQPWSNGKVAMHGLSYEGTVQWRAAMARPPHLVTIVPSVASTSPYHDWVTQNGAWRLSFNFDWGAIRQESRITQNSGPYTVAGGPESLSLGKILWHLPLNDMQRLAGRNARFYKDWMSHPDYDDYWKAIDAEEVFDKIGIPALNFGGWFDIFRQGTLRGYAGMHSRGATAVSRDGAALVIGPWGHWPSRKTGAIDFGETAFVDQNALALRWFDHWLKGVDNGVGREPAVRLFVMGINQWRYEREYPLARTSYRKLYLADVRKLSWNPPAQQNGADRYTYDPNHPAPGSGGASDLRSVEKREDVLVYVSDKLSEPVEITGPVKLVLFGSSDAGDTDFVARLVDVFPDGRAISVASGILRARYRLGAGRPEFLRVGEVYELPVDLIGTSNVFNRGHRIRLDITSSDFPAFDRHLNTIEPFGTGATPRLAHQTIYRNAAHASYLLAPVIPSEKRQVE